MRRLLLSLCVCLLAADAAAQYPARAHMEGCLVWGSAGGNLAVRNECGRPTTLMLMTFDDGRTLQSEIAPGASFDTGRRAGEGFMFTACPVGFVPSVRFVLENKQPISESLYNCQSGRPDV